MVCPRSCKCGLAKLEFKSRPSPSIKYIHPLSLRKIYQVTFFPKKFIFLDNQELYNCLSFCQRKKERKKESEVAQLCLTLCNPLDCSLPGSAAYGIFEARVLEWVVISFSRGSSWTRDWNPGLPHCGQMLYHLSHQGEVKKLNDEPLQSSWLSRKSHAIILTY